MQDVFNRKSYLNQDTLNQDITWGVQVVLIYVKINFRGLLKTVATVQDLIKQLNFKLVILLALISLTSAPRLSATHSLDIRFMTTHYDHIKLVF